VRLGRAGAFSESTLTVWQQREGAMPDEETPAARYRHLARESLANESA